MFKFVAWQKGYAFCDSKPSGIAYGLLCDPLPSHTKYQKPWVDESKYEGIW